MRVLLIDDHKLFSEGMKFLLTELDSEMEIFETGNCEEAIEQYPDKAIDLILLDYHIPGEPGSKGLVKIRKAFSSSVIVIISSEDDPRLIRELIEKGAAGFIPKSSTHEVLIAALKLVITGETYLPPVAINIVCDPLASPAAKYETTAKNLLDHLTDRQREVLDSMVKGRANKVIAREMNITESTVKAHLSAAYRALGVGNRTEAVFVAAKLGLELG